MEQLVRIRFVAALAVLPLWAAAAFAQTPGGVVSRLDTAGLKALVAEVGMQVMLEDRTGMYVSDGEMRPMRVMLGNCVAGECSYLRALTRYEVGGSKTGLAAAEAYRQALPDSYVGILRDGGDVTVEVGRDVNLAAGPSRTAVLAELKLSAEIAKTFLDDLAKKDPVLAGELGYGDDDS